MFLYTGICCFTCMPVHTPKNDLGPDGKVVKDDFKGAYQVSVHIAEYQREYIKEVREMDDETFNLSKTVRRVLDAVIQEDEHELPDRVLVDKEEREQEMKKQTAGIDSFITDD